MWRSGVIRKHIRMMRTIAKIKFFWIFINWTIKKVSITTIWRTTCISLNINHLGILSFYVSFFCFCFNFIIHSKKKAFYCQFKYHSRTNMFVWSIWEKYLPCKVDLYFLKCVLHLSSSPFKPYVWTIVVNKTAIIDVFCSCRWKEHYKVKPSYIL